MKKVKLSLTTKHKITGFLFISIWLIGILAFYIRTLFQTVLFSFSKVSILDQGGYSLQFAGLSNFQYALFKHGTFNQILAGSVSDMLIDLPLIVFFSLLMAMLLNQRFRGRTFIRAIFFIPVIMSSGAINDAIELARQAIQGGIGVESAEFTNANSGISIQYFIDVFMQLGFPSHLIDYVVDVVSRIYEVIKASGVQIVIFLAALQSVPGSLYEVSKIEGATAYETFWKVTLPMVSPLILTNVVYTIVDSFINSDVVDIAYQTAFKNLDYGLSSAMSVMSTLITCAILLIIGLFISKKTFYYN